MGIMLEHFERAFDLADGALNRDDPPVLSCRPGPQSRKCFRDRFETINRRLRKVRREQPCKLPLIRPDIKDGPDWQVGNPKEPVHRRRLELPYFIASLSQASFNQLDREGSHRALSSSGTRKSCSTT